MRDDREEDKRHGDIRRLWMEENKYRWKTEKKNVRNESLFGFIFQVDTSRDMVYDEDT